jgi:hypothetical protein
VNAVGHADQLRARIGKRAHAAPYSDDAKSLISGLRERTFPHARTSLPDSAMRCDEIAFRNWLYAKTYEIECGHDASPDLGPNRSLSCNAAQDSGTASSAPKCAVHLKLSGIGVSINRKNMLIAGC